MSQLEIACILTNLSTGSSKEIKHITDLGGLDIILNFLESDSPKFVEQVNKFPFAYENNRVYGVLKILQ